MPKRKSKKAKIYLVVNPENGKVIEVYLKMRGARHEQRFYRDHYEIKTTIKRGYFVEG